MINTFQCPQKPSVTKGFQMTFANGNTISIMFGRGNYCSNRNESNSSSNDVEISIWNSKDINYLFEKERLEIGWCNMNDVAKWIDFTANNTF